MKNNKIDIHAKAGANVIRPYSGADALHQDSCNELFNALLDSNLIVTTNKKSYDLKIIDCGNYLQVYSKDNKFVVKDNGFEKTKDFDIKNIDTDNLIKTDSKVSKDSSYTIDLKNVMRSKLECQRLAKTNSSVWSTFITLTFKDNIENIDIANKSFRNFVDSVKRVYKDFKYICIPEFQKRGAVHYHLLSNISIDSNLITIQKKDRKTFYHVKYWNYGFNKVDIMQGDIKKIVGYISKYMTKDIDNRLFNRHRYFYSRNLTRPISYYLNFSKESDLEYYNTIIKNKSLIYENNYISKFDDSIINFKEYL